MHGLALLLLLVFPSFAAQKYKSPDEKKDWKGVLWGRSPGEDMKCETSPGPDMQTCTRPAESGDTALGELKVDAVRYTYFEKRLYKIEVVTNSDQVASELSLALRRVYGPGEWEAATEQEAWSGTSIQVGFSRARRTPGGTITYLYVPFLKDVEKAAAKAGGASMTQLDASL